MRADDPRDWIPPTLPDGSPWPRISIVTASFNQEQYIEATILSVANQGYPDVEHIVIDGGSTDGTAAVIESYRDRLAYAVSEPDRGQSHAINKGMARATGGILTWLNSDDMLAPGALHTVAMAFWRSKADMVAGVVTLTHEGRCEGHHLTSCGDGPLPLEDLLDLDGGWNAEQFFYQPEVMFRRELWERAGARVREDLHYSMDYDLWLRFAEAGAKLHVIGRPVAQFRRHAEQKTHAAESFKAELRAYRDEYLKTKGAGLAPRQRKALPQKSLRIALVNDVGYELGAGIAHRRMAEMLKLAGHEVKPFALAPLEGKDARFARSEPCEMLARVESYEPDLVIAGNVHSAGGATWEMGALAAKYPSMWVLHDFWWLTGRCAYTGACTKYLSGCDATCPTPREHPALAPEKIAGAWRRKRQLLAAGTPPMLLANSRWTAEFASRALSQESAMPAPEVPVAEFRLCFPLDVFRPLDRQACREALGLPADAFVVLVGGDYYDPRKRVHRALEELAAAGVERLVAVAPGDVREGEKFPEWVVRPGYVRDPGVLAQYYGAADVIASASTDETFGQVFAEASACARPAIGYRGSGVTEAITDGVTGILVDEDEPGALSAAVRQIFDDLEHSRAMGGWGRLLMENERSPYSGYHSLFQAWSRHGWLERLGLSPKIEFLAGTPGEAGSERTGARIWIETGRLGREEGPYPEFGLPSLRWAFGPVSSFNIHAPEEGKATLILRFRNTERGQRVGVLLNDEELGEFVLPHDGLNRDRILCLGLPLKQGENPVELRFSHWKKHESDPRQLALILTAIHCFADPTP